MIHYFRELHAHNPFAFYFILGVVILAAGATVSEIIERSNR